MSNIYHNTTFPLKSSRNINSISKGGLFDILILFYTIDLDFRVLDFNIKILIEIVKSKIPFTKIHLDIE